MLRDNKYTTPVVNRLRARMTELLLDHNLSKGQASRTVAKELNKRYRGLFTERGVSQFWDKINANAKLEDKVVFCFATKTYKIGDDKTIVRNRPKALPINLKKMVRKVEEEVKQPSSGLQVLEGVTPKNIVVHSTKTGVSIHINMD